MNTRTKATQPLAVRYAGWWLITGLLLIIPIGYGVWHVDEASDNQAAVWLPRDYPATRDYDWFSAQFGSDQVILVSWDGCTLSDHRLEQFASILENQPAGSSFEDPGLPGQLDELIQRVTTGQRVIRQLTSQPIRLADWQAQLRMRGVLVGPDGELTCALVQLTPAGHARRHEIVELLRKVATRYCDVPADAVHLSGDVVINVAIDNEGDRAVDRWILPSVVISLAAAWICLRSIKLGLIVFILSQCCSFGVEALIYFGGGSMNLLLTLVPVLVYVLTLSACVHLTNYYRDARAEGAGEHAPAVALRHGWYPCFISALTTGLGLASLTVSHVAPVRSFGWFGCWGVLLAFGWCMMLLPAALSKFASGPATDDSQSPESASQQALADAPRWLAIAPLLVKYRFSVLAFTFVLLIVAVGGVMRIQTAVSPKRFLPAASRCIQDVDWFQANIGPLTQFEIIVGFDGNRALKFADRMRLVRDIQRQIHGIGQVRGSVSSASFAPDLGELRAPGGTRQYAQRVLLNRKLEDERSAFLREGYLAEDDEHEWWRISLRVARFKDLNVDQFTREISERVETLVADYGLEPDSLPLKFTGTVPLLLAAQQELLDSLVLSFALAVGMITLVMMLTLRSPVAGAIVMLPNLFPAALVFGIMGWSEVVLDVGSMMTASIALGIAVDDTLHFLTWYRRAVLAGRSRRHAIVDAFRRCAPAMMHTTMIAGLGLCVFVFSDFQPVSRFGGLMFAMLVAALVGDLLILPALLASPLGRWFVPRRARSLEDILQVPPPMHLDPPLQARNASK